MVQIRKGLLRQLEVGGLSKMISLNEGLLQADLKRITKREVYAEVLIWGNKNDFILTKRNSKTLYG